MSSDFKLISLSEDGVVAVITINDIEDSNYLCDALISGGVKTIELTLRTKNAFRINKSNFVRSNQKVHYLCAIMLYILRK